jgi:hypothetical protein
MHVRAHHIHDATGLEPGGEALLAVLHLHVVQQPQRLAVDPGELDDVASAVQGVTALLVLPGRTCFIGLRIPGYLKQWDAK